MFRAAFCQMGDNNAKTVSSHTRKYLCGFLKMPRVFMSVKTYKYYICSDDCGEIFMKPSVNKCR